MTEVQKETRLKYLKYRVPGLHHARKYAKIEYRALTRAIAEKRWVAASRLIQSILVLTSQDYGGNTCYYFSHWQIAFFLAQLQDNSVNGPTFRKLYHQCKTDVPTDVWWKSKFMLTLDNYYYSTNTEQLR